MVISKAGKGNTTVILDRNAYNKKLLTMSSDTSTYKELKRDPTKKTKEEVNHFISKFRSKGKITVSDTFLLKILDAHPPRLFGLPKIHKADVPLRPIVSFTGSPTYNLFKELAKTLSHLIGNSHHHVKNSLEFVKTINRNSAGRK